MGIHGLHQSVSEQLHVWRIRLLDVRLQTIGSDVDDLERTSHRRGDRRSVDQRIANELMNEVGLHW